MVQIVPINYTNEHYKPVNFINGSEHGYHSHPTPPPPPFVQAQHQQMPIPIPVPIMNHMMPPHPQPGFYAPPPQPMYAQEQPNQPYVDYNGYPVGFVQQGYFADMSVFVPTLNKTYPLSSNILSRSPVLYQRIQEEQSNTLELDLYVLQETFDVVIGHLYRPLTDQEIFYFASEKPQIAIELLEAAEELGLDPLLDKLLQALSQNLNNQKTAMMYIGVMDTYQPLEGEEPRRWVGLLEDEVVLYMTRMLSSQLEAFSTIVKVSGNVTIGQISACGYMPSRTPPMRGLNDLTLAFSKLPLHLLTKSLEHPLLPVQDAIQRLYFARQVLSLTRHPLTAVLRFENGKNTVAIVKQTELKKGNWDPKLYDTIQ
ncbi:hypothetical protein K501DRAFT_230618 [Backusella circina FSU 941]|nr:hypothetical protein K501DRAFT_230618 [Backusella circina FSU 941]